MPTVNPASLRRAGHARERWRTMWNTPYNEYWSLLYPIYGMFGVELAL